MSASISATRITRLDLELSFDMLDGEAINPVLFQMQSQNNSHSRGKRYKLVDAEHHLGADFCQVPYYEDARMQSDAAREFIGRERVFNPEKKIHYLIIPIEEL